MNIKSFINFFAFPGGDRQAEKVNPDISIAGYRFYVLLADPYTFSNQL